MNQQAYLAELLVLEATEAAEQVQCAHVPEGEITETLASTYVFGSFTALRFNLKLLGISILEGMKNIDGSLAIENQHFNQTSTLAEEVPSSTYGHCASNPGDGFHFIIQVVRYPLLAKVSKSTHGFSVLLFIFFPFIRCTAC